MADPPPEEIRDALTCAIADELAAQLAMASVNLDKDYIEGIAGMVAEEILLEFAVTQRAEPLAP